MLHARCSSVSSIVALLIGCGAGHHRDDGPNTDGDIDADSDADVDSDADSDAGTDDDMITIEAATFSMGCNAEADITCADVEAEPFLADEHPYHLVSLSEYQIDRTEVTQSRYEACVNAGACQAPSAGYDPVTFPENPVTVLTWEEANGYCTWAGKRLPMEAEWEYAARGSDGRVYPWGSDRPSCDLAQSGPCGAMLPVGSLLSGASYFGAMDMAGNVSEWVFDFYSRTYYDESPEQDPTGPAEGTTHVRRGGHWNGSNTALRTSSRHDEVYDLTAVVGIRCAIGTSKAR